MNWKLWLKCAAVRALKTVCQTALAVISTAAVISEVDWKYAVSASLLAGILSVLTSLAGLPEVDQQAQVVRYDDDRSDDAPIFEEEN